MKKTEKIYIWMLIYLPKCMMWYNVYEKNDMGSKFWQPRFGYPKSWLKESEKEAEEILKNIKWE